MPAPEHFLSSIDYVDQLDVDGDRIGEVFTIQGGFDAYAYVIFKKVGGRWREVYQVIRDACGCSCQLDARQRRLLLRVRRGHVLALVKGKDVFFLR